MIKKLKVGILLNDDLKLQDGHVKIVNQISKSDFINLNQIFTYNKLPKINLIINFLYKFISYTEKKYNQITRVKEEKNLKKILNHKGPILVDVLIDPKSRVKPKIEYGKPLHDMYPYIDRSKLNIIMKK